MSYYSQQSVKAVLKQTVHMERGTPVMLSITFVEIMIAWMNAQSIQAMAEDPSKPILFILCLNSTQNFITYM